MEFMKDIFFSELHTICRIGGHYYLPPNEVWKIDNDVFDQNIFYYIISGRCSITINGKEYIGTAGDWFFIPAGTRYSYYNFKDEPFEKYWIHFDMYPSSDLSKILQLEHCAKKVSDKKIKELFESFVSLRKSDKICDKIEVNSVVLMLLSKYIKLTGSNTLSLSKTSAYTQELYNVLKYIDENLEKHLSNVTLAECMHMHTNHFIKYFKKNVGHTPQRYVSLRRIESAKRLLENTNLSMDAIAEMTGLCDSAHLSKLFKKVYAVSPSQYRKGNRIHS